MRSPKAVGQLGISHCRMRETFEVTYQGNRPCNKMLLVRALLKESGYRNPWHCCSIAHLGLLAKAYRRGSVSEPIRLLGARRVHRKSVRIEKVDIGCFRDAWDGCAEL